MKSPVAVEKLLSRLKQAKFGGWKMSTRPEKIAIVGLPDAILFLRNLQEGVFQQPRLIAPAIEGCAGIRAYSIEIENKTISISHGRNETRMGSSPAASKSENVTPAAVSKFASSVRKRAYSLRYLPTFSSVSLM